MSTDQPVAGAGEPPPDGLAARATLVRIAALMVGRRPEVLRNPAHAPVITETVRGVATEVRAVIGANPSPEVFEAGVWAVVLGAAASLESALFPEQQLGDNARSEQLRGRYLGVLADLRRSAAAAGGAGGRISGLVHLGMGGAGVAPAPDPYRY